MLSISALSNNDINGNRRISASAGDLSSINQNQKMPFVPSKRMIQHHEYQNLVDDVTPSIVNGLRKRETSRQRHKSEHGTYDSIVPMPDNRYVDNNNNQQQQQKQQMKRESNRTGVSAGAGTGASGQQMVNGPVYRHFGDTNLMRNHNGKSPINHNRNLMNKSNSTTSLATTAICGGGGEGSSAGGDSSSSIYNSNQYRTRSIGQDIDQHSYPDAKMAAVAADKLNNNNHSNQNAIRSTTTDTFNPMASNPYITSNLTNDTGFSSMDADNSSTITPNNHKISDKTNKINATNPNNNNYYSAAFDQIQRMNYDVKNRIKMFDVVDRSAAYRPVVCHKNYKPRSDKRFVQIIILYAGALHTQALTLGHFEYLFEPYASILFFRIDLFIFMMSAAALMFLFRDRFFFPCPSDVMFYVICNGVFLLFHFFIVAHSISHLYGKAQNSAGSSSNVSSSNSNNSDGFNSLDSMENEIQHKNNHRRRPIVPTNGISAPIKAKSSSKSAGDSLSYLGPFNFRQLLRPIQGPTNSLRKRRSGKV